MKVLKIKIGFTKTADTLSDVELGRLFRGMLKYASSGAEPSLAGSERILWPAVKEEIDAQLKSFDHRSAANTENVTKRYESIRNATKNYESYKFVEQEESGEKGEKKSSPLEPPVKENTPKEGKEEQRESKKRARTTFVPPTLDEVRAYVRERNSPVDPVQFWEYFEAGSWKDSEGKPVLAWKQKLLTWEKHQTEKGGGNGNSRVPERNREKRYNIHYDA